MKRVLAVVALAFAATVLVAPGASATIHPLVESFDCANDQAFTHHPLNDPADPPGQTPGEAGSTQSDFRAIEEAIDTPAAFGHKLDNQCGQVGR